MVINDAINEYLLACAADGRSAATITWYRSVLKSLAVHFLGRELDTLTGLDVRLYIVDLQARKIRYLDSTQKPPQPGGLSAASINSHIRGLHAFFSWAAIEYGLQNPMRNIQKARILPPKPKAIAAADFVRLFNATGDNDAGIRDRAILVFLVDTGCRLKGLLNLKLDDLDLVQLRAVVCEKGEKLRAVVFTTYTARALEMWLRTRASPGPYVFVSLTTGDQLTSSGVNQMLNRLKARARVTGRVNAHSFRHNFAREYLRNGGDLVTLARLLGHADVSTTAAYYAVFSQNELAAMHEKFSPIKGMIGLNSERLEIDS